MEFLDHLVVLNLKSEFWHWVILCIEVSKLHPLVCGQSPLVWIITPDVSPSIPVLPSSSLSCTWQPGWRSWNCECSSCPSSALALQWLPTSLIVKAKVHTGLRPSLMGPPSPSQPLLLMTSCATSLLLTASPPAPLASSLFLKHKGFSTSALLTLGLAHPLLWERLRMFSYTPGLYPGDAHTSLYPHPNGDKWKCLQIWPDVPWGKNCHGWELHTSGTRPFAGCSLSTETLFLQRTQWLTLTSPSNLLKSHRYPAPPWPPCFNSVPPNLESRSSCPLPPTADYSTPSNTLSDFSHGAYLLSVFSERMSPPGGRDLCLACSPVNPGSLQ